MAEDPGGTHESHALSRLIFDSTLDAVIVIDASGRVQDWNGRAEALFGWTVAEALGRNMADLIIPHRHREAHARGMARFLTTGHGPILGRRMEMTALRRDGEEFPVELTISAVRAGQDWRFIGFLRDQTVEKRAQGRLQVQIALYRLLSGSPSREEIAGTLLATVCELDPWLAGACWRPEGDVLRCCGFRERTGKAFPKFRGQTLALSLRKGEGLPGRAWERKAPVWIADVRGEQGLPRLEAGLEEGLFAAFALPVRVRGEAALVFEFFSRQPREPDEELLGFAVSLAGQLGQYLERKAAEEEVARNERRFRTLTEATTDAILVVAADATLAYASGSLEKVLGYAEGELIGTNGLSLVHPDDLPKAQNVLAAVLTEQGSSLAVELRIRHRDGTWRWVEGKAVNLLADPIVAGILVNLRDITERRLAQDEREALLGQLQGERARLSAILDFTPTPMVLADPADGRLIFANKAADALAGGKMPLGRLAEENPDLLSLTHADGRPVDPRESPTSRAIRGETLVDVEMIWTVGTVRHHLLVNSATLRGTDGKPETIVIAFLDITHLKQVEEQLRQSQKMEAIGQLAGGIAHDFNNLLTAINGYSSMALEKLDSADPLHAFMTEVLRSGERAAGLTRQLLAYSRKQVLEPKLWDLNVIVQGMQAMLRRLIGEDVILGTDLDPAPALVKVDRGQVEQVLLNLSLNSRDAMPGGGRLVLETRRITLDEAYVAAHPEAAVGRHVRLAVSDTGTGMTADVKAKAFEPFFTTKEVGKGTGLGLSSVYGIVKQSGGFLDVYSEPGHGTTVKIFFPEAGPGSGPGEAAAAAPGSFRGSEIVLLVEDEEAVRRFAAQALEVQGYSVIRAANGHEALQALEARGGEVSLVVTDVVMPDMGGQVLADRVRSLRPELPILFMSGYTESSIIHRGITDRKGAFLQKPFGPTDLARAVRQTLDRSATAQRETERKASE